MHYVGRALLQIAIGVGLVALCVVVERTYGDPDPWWIWLFLPVLFCGLFTLAHGALLLMGEDWRGIAPGPYYVYTCPQCGRIIRSHAVRL